MASKRTSHAVYETKYHLVWTPDDAPVQPRPCRHARALKKQGLTIVEIAKALGVKERTVYHYLRQS